MKKYMNKTSLFMTQYYDIFSNERSMSNPIEYYNALVRFVRRNDRYFTEELLKTYRLDILITLDPKEYICAPFSFSLDHEKERCSEWTYSNLSSLAMSISNTLWEMVALYSGKVCPITGEYGLYYVLLSDGNDRKILLEECEQCGWLQDEAGCEYTGTIKRIFPATRWQVQDYRKEK
ncbi:hypothetical protein [Candidatus Enterococcus clewellii]|uniref:Uncharacterized protein n=1 Tax=Candidatus Enterococcus clewellii TaxID=1834193 RepID=A0AAQ3VY20_9ENTE